MRIACLEMIATKIYVKKQLNLNFDLQKEFLIKSNNFSKFNFYRLNQRLLNVYEQYHKKIPTLAKRLLPQPSS